MRLRTCASAAVLVAAAVTVTGCGGAAGSHGSLRAGDGGAPPAPKSAGGAGKAVVPVSPDLKLAVSPTSGAPGTVVHVTATGCVDANGMNHAVSFNAADRSAGRNPHVVRAVEATLAGTTLTASYTVTNADRGAGHGVFYVQCGSSLASAPFTVTR
jgi:hypothetical protein